jgi:hypothetical protein
MQSRQVWSVDPGHHCLRAQLQAESELAPRTLRVAPTMHARERRRDTISGRGSKLRFWGRRKWAVIRRSGLFSSDNAGCFSRLFSRAVDRVKEFGARRKNESSWPYSIEPDGSWHRAQARPRTSGSQSALYGARYRALVVESCGAGPGGACWWHSKRNRRAPCVGPASLITNWKRQTGITNCFFLPQRL